MTTFGYCSPLPLQPGPMWGLNGTLRSDFALARLIAFLSTREEIAQLHGEWKNDS